MAGQHQAPIKAGIVKIILNRDMQIEPPPDLSLSTPSNTFGTERTTGAAGVPHEPSAHSPSAFLVAVAFATGGDAMRNGLATCAGWLLDNRGLEIRNFEVEVSDAINSNLD